MAARVRKIGISSVKNEDLLLRSFAIIKYTHESTAAFHAAFGTVKAARAKAGSSTDEEQDLLRAMLVMTAAGLDSAIKQIIRDSLPAIIKTDKAALTELEGFVAKRLRGDEDGNGLVPSKFLARVLSAQSHREQIIEEYIKELTGSSLQSAQELFKASKALGINPSDVGITETELKPIFVIRNKIIHELDIDFEHPKRNRQTRKQSDMCKYSNTLLVVAEKILDAVDKKIQI